LSIANKVASKRAASPRRRLWAWIALGVVLAAFGTLVLRDTIERITLERSLAARFGGDASIAGLRHESGMRVLTGVRLAGGGISLAADRVELTATPTGLEAVVRGLRAHVVLDRLRLDEPARLGALEGVLGADRYAVRVLGGVVEVVRGADAAVTVALNDVTGNVQRTAAGVGYDVKLALADGGRSYPLSGSGRSEGAQLVQHWSADLLPAAPLAALLPASTVLVHGGVVRNLSLHAAGTLRATLTLAEASARVGNRELRGLGGPLIVTEDGVGTPGISAKTDDGAPFSLVGEVHDAAGWPHAVRAGIKDLDALERLFTAVAAQPELKWMRFETTAPGVVYGQYAMTTKGVPHVVSMLAVDPREPTLHFDTALADDHIISTGARTTQLGARTQAVAGVNGDYFDIGRTYEPQGMLVRNGVLLHGPTDHYALAFDRHNKVTFAVFHLSGTVVDGARSYRITQLNSWPSRYVSVITPDYGKRLPGAAGMSFAALEPLGGNRYRVVSIESADAPQPVRFGLGFGRSIAGPLPRRGDVVEVSYALDPPVSELASAISSGPLLLKNGEWFEDKRAPAPDERDVQWPVVALGTTADETLLLAAVDGRHPERSIGMTRPEFAELLRALGVIDAMALDSGGSVTMVSRTPGEGTVSLHNVPSDQDAERYISDALFVYSSAPPGPILSVPKTAALGKPPT
jgi:exopolysaccharide biosynthesis protein